MNHIAGVNNSRFGGFYSYKYNGKELQETGMFDYGWRHYMPDLGRWNGIDQLAEKYHSTSPFAYVAGNPVSRFDVDGRWFREDGSIDTSGRTPSFTGGRAMMTNFYGYNPWEGGGGPGDGRIPAPKNNPGFFDRIGSFFSRLFGGDKGAGMASATAGALQTKGVIDIGAATFEGVAPALNLDAILAGITRAGLWSLPLILEGDTSRKDQTIILYRGVCVGHYDYKNALQGKAVPLGGHSDPELHNWGDTESIFTSWTINQSVAEKFANNNGLGGVILKKTFLIQEVIPSPDKYNEQEVLVPGIVIGALPIIIKNK